MRRDRASSGRVDPRNAGTLLKVLAAVIMACAVLSLLQFGAITETTNANSATGHANNANANANNANGNGNSLRDRDGEADKPTEKPGAPVIAEPVVEIESGSRGILMCLHNRIVPLGASLVRELRCLGNDEPIEVYHCSELSASNQELLRTVDSNLQIIDICASLVSRGVMNEQLAHSFRSYWIKPLALHQTKFQEPIMVDADVIALKDPAVLRSIDGYKQKGTVFFYDRVIWDANFFNRRITPRPGAKQEYYLPHWLKTFNYTRFGITDGYSPSQHVLQSWGYRAKTCHEMDSSMLLVDKRRAGKAMSVLWFLITEHRFNIEFSLGDKEAFWLAYEFAHAPYFFSPWGASVVSSMPNRDVERFEATLCGCLCHFMPVDDATPELLYLNGRQVVDAIPFNLDNLKDIRKNLVFNLLPTHMTPRQKRANGKGKHGEHYDMECNVGLGKTPTPPQLRHHLWRRRLHFMAISMGMLEPLQSCDMGGHVSRFDPAVTRP